jgi:hypothetical protein
MGKADAMEATAKSGDSSAGSGDTLVRRQRRWARRNRTFAKWRRAYSAGRELHGLSPRERFMRLVRAVETEDRFGNPERHLLPRQPGTRMRVAGRRVGMAMASWLIHKGAVDPAYRARSICGLAECCEPSHLRLVLRKEMH